MYLPPYIRDIHGTVFPPSPIERELFYRDDLHAWYQWNGAGWVNLHPAGPHAVTHNAGGADQMAIDQAAGTGSLRTLGGGAVQAAPGNHTHTLVADTSYSKQYGGSVGSVGTYYRVQHSLSALQEYTYASQNVTFAAGSMAFGVGMAHGRCNGTSSIKIRMYLGGVQVGESSYFGTTDELRVATGFRALSGSQQCKVTAKNYKTATRYFEFFGYNISTERAVGFSVGSVKI